MKLLHKPYQIIKSKEIASQYNNLNQSIIEYYFSKTITETFDNTVLKVTEALKAEGFGILTEINVKATLKKKPDVDFYYYKILGACNPPFAYKALLAEDKIGIMLPCNVVVHRIVKNY